MTREYKWYWRLYPVLKFLVWLFGFPKVTGRENIPDGACVVVANHTSNIDCFFMVEALTRRNHTRILAKAELFKIPLVGGFLRLVGMIRVDRSIADMAPVRESLAHLKSGGKIGVFPQGRRITSDEAVEAKSGAVRLAERTGSPILPMFIPQKKRIFRRNAIIVGKPYYLPPGSKRASAEELAALSDEMLRRIRELEP